MKIRDGSPALDARAATVRADSYSEDDHAIDVVFTTGARVVRRPWFGESFTEELATDAASVRLGRLNGGAPFLDSHSSGRLSSVLGAVVRGSAKMEDGQGVARVVLSREPEDAPIVNKIRDGIISNVSVGYEIHAREITEAGDGVIALHRATDWEPFEISAVAMGADPDAHIRSMYEARGLVVTDPPPAATPAPTPEAPPVERVLTTTRTEVPAMTPEEIKAQTAVAVAEALAVDKVRRTGIASTVRALGASDTVAALAATLVDDGTAVDAARAQLIDLAAGEQKPLNPQVRVEEGDTDNVVAIHAAMERAIMHKAFPGKHKHDEDSRQFVGMSLMEMGKESAALNGVSLRGLSKLKQAKHILAYQSERIQQRHAGGAFHTTSDFPLLLADVINKTLRNRYEETPRTFTPWCVQNTARDFRDIQRTAMGEAPRMLEVNEHAEFTRGTIGEDSETYNLVTFGRIVGVSRQALINDDLRAFTRLASGFGQSAASLQSDVVYAILTANAAMSDGIALFDATAFDAGHQNIVGAGGVPSVAQFGLMRDLMRQQVGIGDGTTFPSIDVMLKYIICPTAAELAAEQVVSPLYAPTTAATTVPGSMRGLEVIGEPRLDATSAVVYYGAASPGMIDTVEYSFLEGEEGVSTETLNGWDVDGVEVKARLDFAAKAIDHRGLCRNPGA